MYLIIASTSVSLYVTVSVAHKVPLNTYYLPTSSVLLDKTILIASDNVFTAVHYFM